MEKPKIDDDMADRAGRAWYGKKAEYEPEFHRARMKQALEAALNPPPEPEIVVSEAMLDAGNDVWNKVHNLRSGDDEWPRKPDSTNVMLAIYRAMARQRRNEELCNKMFSQRPPEKPEPAPITCHRCGHQSINPGEFHYCVSRTYSGPSISIADYYYHGRKRFLFREEHPRMHRRITDLCRTGTVIPGQLPVILVDGITYRTHLREEQRLGIVFMNKHRRAGDPK